MKLHTDAARDGEVAGFAWELVTDDGEKIEGSRYLVDDCTSMEAEYYALLDGLRHSRRHGSGSIDVYSDCQPLLQKMRVPDENEDWYQRRQGCHRLLNKFDDWSLAWTPRSRNTRADRLAYEALEAGRQGEELNTCDD